MQKTYPVLVLGIIFIVIVALFAIASDSVQHPHAQACTQEAEICPDGTAVGRTGPNCEFAPCPDQTALPPASPPAPTPSATTSASDSGSPSPTPASEPSLKLTAKIGQTVTGLNISITPEEVIEDSRCPASVQCIW